MKKKWVIYQVINLDEQKRLEEREDTEDFEDDDNIVPIICDFYSLRKARKSVKGFHVEIRKLTHFLSRLSFSDGGVFTVKNELIETR